MEYEGRQMKQCWLTYKKREKYKKYHFKKIEGRRESAKYYVAVSESDKGDRGFSYRLNMPFRVKKTYFRLRPVQHNY